VLSKGGITRRQTLTIAITTAGVQNESPLAWKLHEKTRRLKRASSRTIGSTARSTAAAAEDDPADPATWLKANPSLLRLMRTGKKIDGFITEDKIRKEYESAESEGDLTSFKTVLPQHLGPEGKPGPRAGEVDASAGEWKTPGLLPKLAEDKVRTLRTTSWRGSSAHVLGRRPTFR